MGNQTTFGQASDPAIPIAGQNRKQAQKYDESIPIEELSMAEIFPDLNIANLMQIDRIDSKYELGYLHQNYIQNPLPVVQVSFTKPVPRPVYTQLSVDDSAPKRKMKTLPKFARFIEATEDELARRVEYDMDEQGRFDAFEISYIYALAHI
jgi:hypothetical protein